MECKQVRNAHDCPCTYNCSRKGICCECVTYHRTKNQIPACFFSKDAEKSYNRSVEALIKDWSKK
ncbi:MAG: DUF6485 family protein [Christensenellaceae bacterium]